MSEQTAIEITQILKESPNLPKANEIGYFFMENQVVWAMEEYSKHKLNQLQAKHDEELKRNFVNGFRMGYVSFNQSWTKEQVEKHYDEHYKANHETNEQANQNNSSNDTRRTID